MSEKKMLKIENYQKMLNGAHPIYTCITAEDRPSHYMFEVNDDTQYNIIYTFKLAKKEEINGGWILTILWGSDMDYTIIQKEDMKSFRNLYSLMCGMIDSVSKRTDITYQNLPF